MTFLTHATYADINNLAKTFITYYFLGTQLWDV